MQHQDFVPATGSELSRFVLDNWTGSRQPLYPVGGRTSLNFGYPPTRPGYTITCTKLGRIIDYPARDMTITVEAGLRVSELAATLRTESQQLPIDVPQPARGTIGGAVATNASGPRRFGYGTLRDYVIGIGAVDSQGRLFHAGGRVVKNVAGYDLCKLLVGSLGTLAVITELTFKLKPIPESSAMLWAPFAALKQIDAALSRLMTSAARPVALEVLNASAAAQIAVESRLDVPTADPVLALLVEGTPQQTAWQIDALQEEILALGPKSIEVLAESATGELLKAITEYPTVSDDPLTFRANLPPSKTIEFIELATAAGVSVAAHAGNGIVIGHLPDSAVTLERSRELIEPLRGFARRHRGNLVILNCDAAWKPALPLFGEPEPSWPLMRKVKQALDPAGLLNPGRFIDHL